MFRLISHHQAFSCYKNVNLKIPNLSNLRELRLWYFKIRNFVIIDGPLMTDRPKHVAILNVIL